MRGATRFRLVRHAPHRNGSAVRIPVHNGHVRRWDWGELVAGLLIGWTLGLLTMLLLVQAVIAGWRP